MISRRNYFSIVTLMIVLFCLLMVTNNFKDQWNDYTVNIYVETAENYPSKVSLPWSLEAGEDPEAGEAAETYTSRGTVVLIGDSEGDCGKAVHEWSVYSKRGFAAYASLKSYKKAADADDRPEILIIDSACVNWYRKDETAFLTQCVEQGTHLVFCTLPDVSVIKNNEQVCDLLGIREAVAEKTTASGLHLYEGFLLGGEKVYLSENEKDRDADIVFPGKVNAAGKPTFPWYLLTSGTKVYMKGIPQDKSVDKEDYPALIWRKSFGTAYVFAVNGGYMDGIEAIGILSAISSEMRSYGIYPVVNAQNMVITGYPSLADENRAEMERIYGRSVKDVFQETLWPNIRTAMNRHGCKATCMMTPQLDYSDRALPDKEQMIYYLKIFNEASAEVGLSAVNVSDTPIEQKLDSDRQFIKDAAETYKFASFYAGGLSDEDIKNALQTELLSSVTAVARDYEGGDGRVFGLMSETVISQATFGIGFDYTYKADFMVRCLETALGYMSVSYDMSRVAYPHSDQDAWEKLSAELGTTVDTVGYTFPDFDKTAVAESNARIRRFLSLQYDESRAGNVIRVQTQGTDKTKWFILRTHNETITRVEGGSWKQLEKDAYLISADKEKISITLGQVD